MRQIRTLMTCTAMATVALGSAACGSAAKPAASGAKLVSESAAKANEQGSMSLKIVATQTTGGQAQPVEQLRSKVSAPAAAQSIRFTAGQGNLDVKLIGSTAYVRTDATTLFKGLALPKPAAPLYAGKWISLEQSDPPFSSIADTMTLKAQLDTFLPKGTNVTVGKTRTMDGVRVIPLTGKAAKSGSEGKGFTKLYISESTHLPVAAGVVKRSGSTSIEIVAKFSGWGKPVTVIAPQGAIPYATVVESNG
jgi:hypothetical protein